MSKLIPLPGNGVVEALKRAGFQVIRQSGMLRRIIHDTELTREEFLGLFK